jgi:hypothetical protein
MPNIKSKPLFIWLLAIPTPSKLELRLTMNFRAVFDIVDTMRVAFKIGVPAALRAIIASPSLLLNLTALSRISMANIWIPFGAGSDENSRADKKILITPHARGVVLDLGAGIYRNCYLRRN